MKKPAGKGGRRHLDDDEAADWDHAAKTIEPLKRAKSRVRAGRDQPSDDVPARRAEETIPAASQSRTQPPPGAGKTKPPAPPPKKVVPPIAEFDRKNAKRLRSGRVEIEARLDLALPNREALRRALAILAFPTNAPRAVQLGWRAADAMWRAAGDTATDYNHYTKRAILGSVYAATLAVFLNDESEGLSETRAFLGRRIEGIMRFEKAKARVVDMQPHFSPARFIGRLRYPAR